MSKPQASVVLFRDKVLDIFSSIKSIDHSIISATNSTMFVMEF